MTESVLIAYYDRATSPATYDIVAFLPAVERARIKHGADRVAIRILPGPEHGFRRDKYWPFSIEGRQQMLDRVAIPMARMLPSACEVSLWPTRENPVPGSIGYGGRLYGLKTLVECLAAGIRPLRPPQDLPRDDRLVTITLREAEHWPERNSNVSEWVRAAKELAGRGYRVVVIRDSFFAGFPIEGVATDATAAVDLNRRAQLYRSAVCNLFVNNGPAWFALALDAPALILKPNIETSLRVFAREYFAQCGIPPGGQIPNSPDYQRIVWEEDRCEHIVTALEQFAEARRAAA